MERRVSRRLLAHLFLLCCCCSWFRLIGSSPVADPTAQPSHASHYGHVDFSGHRQTSNNVNWMEFSPPGNSRRGRQQEWPSRPTRPPQVSNWPGHQFQQPIRQQPQLQPDIFHFDFDVPWENNPMRQNRHEFSQYQPPSPPARKPAQVPGLAANPLQGPVPIRVANPNSFHRNPAKKPITPVVTDLEILTNDQPLRSSEGDDPASSEGLLSAFGPSVAQSFPFKVPEPPSTVKTTESQEDLPKGLSEENEEEDAEVESEIAALVSSTVPSVWKLFPLLPPPTPPGKQIIGDFRKTNSQVPDTHRQSASLSAASAFAKSRPHLRERIRGAHRQEPTEKPRPYRRRPVRPTTTTTTTTTLDPRELSEEVPEVPEEDFGIKAVKEDVKIFQNEGRNVPRREPIQLFDEDEKEEEEKEVKEEREEEEKEVREEEEAANRDNEAEYDVKEEMEEVEEKRQEGKEEDKEVDDNNNNEEDEEGEDFLQEEVISTSSTTTTTTTTTRPATTSTPSTTTTTTPSTTTSTTQTTPTTTSTTTPTPSSTTTPTTTTTSTTTTDRSMTAVPSAPPRYSTKPSSTAKPSPEDIKNLLRSSESLSLSEVLQRKGMSLADLLKGGPGLLQQLKASKENTPEPEETSPTSTTTTTTTTTTSAPVEVKDLPIGSIPQVKPISFSDLLSSKNITLTDIVKPKDPPKDLLPLNITSLFRNVYKPSAKPQSTFKPAVKRPAPFRPGSGKGLPNVPAFQSSPNDPELRGNDDNSGEQEESRAPKELPPQPDWSNLKPLVFGGKAAAVPESTTSTTTTSTTTQDPTTKSEKPTTKSRRPYVAPNSVGEYGVYTSVDDDDDDGKNKTDPVLHRIVPFGGQRPIATSRLTPAPPKRQRPISVASDWLEEDRSYPEETSKDVNIIPSSHFNEEELIEESTFDDLPISVKSAIIASSAIGGFCLVVFVAILVAFRLRQKTRVRLRHPAALFGSAIASSAVTGSDSSGVTTPVASPKGGYAKLPYRSSGLWGTLRRTLRQMDSN